jgi:hypothetical protein
VTGNSAVYMNHSEALRWMGRVLRRRKKYKFIQFLLVGNQKRRGYMNL